MDLNMKIGTGAQADVYLYKNSALKVFKEGCNKAFIFYEAMINSFVESTGLSVARVHEVIDINNRIAMRMDYIEGVTLNECLLADIENANKYMVIIVSIKDLAC